MKKNRFTKFPISYSDISKLQLYVNSSKDFFEKLEKLKKRHSDDPNYYFEDFGIDVMSLYDDFKLKVNVK